MLWRAMRWGFLVPLLLACSSESSAGASGQGGSGGSGASGTGGQGATGGQAGSGSVECGSQSAAAIRECVDLARLESDLAFVAQERVPGSAHWQDVQRLCERVFSENGFTTELHDYGGGINVLGRREGTELPAEQLLFTAHYDHIGGCPGADDNASGVVIVLEAARLLKDVSTARTVVLGCWDEEERGLIGARAYAERAAGRGETIAAMYSLEMLGFRSREPDSQTVPPGLDLLFPEQTQWLADHDYVGDFLTIVPDSRAATIAAAVASHAQGIGLPTITLEITDSLKSSPMLGDVRRSDHAAFWDQDFPAMMLTDTSEFRNPNYHCRNGTVDSVDTLDMGFLELNARAAIGGLVEAAELR